jgi:hypothetical protein
LLLIAALFVWLMHRNKKTEVGWAWNLLFLTAHIGYLWYVSIHAWQVVPSNIEPWILDQGALILNQFTFMMPGLFYAGLRFACFETKLSSRSDLGLSLFVAVGAPASFYLFFGLLSKLAWSAGLRFSSFLVSLFFIFVTVLAFIGIIRAVVMIYNYLQSRGEIFQLIFAGIVCLAGPIGGLLLNRTIPFPADFQTPWVYVLAIINGLIVMTPSAQKPEGRGIMLLARSVTFPFTFYFFLVFLPFLPLALPALFALGTGFLFLVPVVLFLFHVKKLIEDFKGYLQSASITSALCIVITGLCVLPGYFTVEALKDKASLDKALQYVYAPDYTRDNSFSGSVKSVKRTLIQLKEFKEGIQLPYLSGFYNRIVFEGMVLPDKKMEYMYRFFTGDDLTKIPIKKNWGMGRMRGGWFGRTGSLPEPNRQVELVKSEIQTETNKDIVKTRVRLQVHNNGSSDRAEFFREIHIPAGVLITGFSLKVGDAFVPGEIFEKRAAMWVYHMIRDYTRRDPGILTYQSPEQVNLNIYPVQVNETREVAIDFQFPAGQNPVITLGDKELILTDSSNPATNQAIVAGSSGVQSFTVLSREAQAQLPKTKRVPYFHFILDASKNGVMNNGAYKERIDAVINAFPLVKRARFSSAHFNVQELTEDPVALDSGNINAALSDNTLKPEGSLDLTRVFKQEWMRYEAQLDKDWLEYPVFVLISRDSTANFMPDVDNAAFFRRMVPDCAYFLAADVGGKFEKRMLWSNTVDPELNAVIILRSGTSVVVLPGSAANMQSAFFKGPSLSTEVSVYNPDVLQFVPVSNVKILNKESAYARGMGLMAGNLVALKNPSDFDRMLTALIEESRRLGVMIPSTSYIVVERSSQWKTLKLKEQQRLGTSQGLEFDDGIQTPSPPMWVMALLLVILLRWKNGLLMLRNWGGSFTRAMGVGQ